jgi:bifunctional non-homologous end joining protein LigD
MIFDLDPDPSLPFSEVKKAAQEIRTRLKKANLDSVLKCTGGKGYH